MKEETSIHKGDKRPFWVSVVLGVGTIVLLALLLTDAKAADTYTLRIGDHSVTLMQEPCDIGGWFKDWKKAQWIYEGKRYEACWRVQQGAQGNPVVHTIDSAGDVGTLPMQGFRKDEAV